MINATESSRLAHSLSLKISNTKFCTIEDKKSNYDSFTKLKQKKEKHHKFRKDKDDTQPLMISTDPFKIIKLQVKCDDRETLPKIVGGSTNELAGVGPDVKRERERERSKYNKGSKNKSVKTKKITMDDNERLASVDKGKDLETASSIQLQTRMNIKKLKSTLEPIKEVIKKERKKDIGNIKKSSRSLSNRELSNEKYNSSARALSRIKDENYLKDEKKRNKYVSKVKASNLEEVIEYNTNIIGFSATSSKFTNDSSKFALRKCGLQTDLTSLAEAGFKPASSFTKSEFINKTDSNFYLGNSSIMTNLLKLPVVSSRDCHPKFYSEKNEEDSKLASSLEKNCYKRRKKVPTPIPDTYEVIATSNTENLKKEKELNTSNSNQQQNQQLTNGISLKVSLGDSIKIKSKLSTFFEKNYYYYVIKSGNNSRVIREALKLRPHWRECVSTSNSLFNFKWKETSTGIDFSRLNKVGSIKQMVNHFECHTEISCKLNLFVNLMTYCEVSPLIITLHKE